MEKKVFIVLVNYNTSSDTVECLLSLSKINYSNFEIVVVDNSSTKDECEILEREEAIKFFLLKEDENKGFAGGCNAGIRYAMQHEAEYILLLNNDTIVTPDFLNELVGTMENDSNTGMVGGKIYAYPSNDLWFANGRYNALTCKVKHLSSDAQEGVKTNFITGCMQLIRCNVIQEVGMLEEKYFMYYEDVEYCRRLIRKGYDLVYNPRAIIYHKCGSSADYKSANAQFYSNRARYLFIREYGGICAMLILKFELFLKEILYKDDRKAGVLRVKRYISDSVKKRSS